MGLNSPEKWGRIYSDLVRFTQIWSDVTRFVLGGELGDFAAKELKGHKEVSDIRCYWVILGDIRACRGFLKLAWVPLGAGADEL